MIEYLIYFLFHMTVNKFFTARTKKQMIKTEIGNLQINAILKIDKYYNVEKKN